MKTTRKIKITLNNCIEEICQSKEKYCANPDTDFTRNKKLPIEKVIKAVLGFSSKSLNNEMIDIFRNDTDMVSVSAFVQQRSKLKSSAFEDIFRKFTSEMSTEKLFQGYRLLAVDGSDLVTPTNRADIDSLFQVKDSSPYNLYHLNALYDLNSNVYLDAVVQKRREENEHKALCDMVDRYSCNSPTVFIADRGYESYNNLAHIQQIGQFFLIRIKDSKSTGMLRGFDLPECDEFDLSIDLSLTRKQTKETKVLFKNRNQYKSVAALTTFDFLPKKSKKHDKAVFFNLKFRLVRFQIAPDKYEVVITNLDKDNFPPQKLKELYARRWGIETSFRSLKYTVGLLHFHAKKSEHIIQEIFAKLTMYNFTELISANISIRKAKRKYPYKINFSVAVNVCRKFFVGLCAPKFVETVIEKHILPIRPNQSNPRNLHSKPAVSFVYRVA